jgi:hypothetical protein
MKAMIRCTCIESPHGTGPLYPADCPVEGFEFRRGRGGAWRFCTRGTCGRRVRHHVENARVPFPVAPMSIYPESFAPLDTLAVKSTDACGGSLHREVTRCMRNTAGRKSSGPWSCPAFADSWVGSDCDAILCFQMIQVNEQRYGSERRNECGGGGFSSQQRS